MFLVVLSNIFQFVQKVCKVHMLLVWYIEAGMDLLFEWDQVDAFVRQPDGSLFSWYERFICFNHLVYGIVGIPLLFSVFPTFFHGARFLLCFAGDHI